VDELRCGTHRRQPVDRQQPAPIGLGLDVDSEHETADTATVQAYANDGPDLDPVAEVLWDAVVERPADGGYVREDAADPLAGVGAWAQASARRSSSA